MDNERPIEKLIRRHAKKRRDESGTPLEMHPATRRLLQGEVARQFKATANSKPPAVHWWPRLVFGLSVIAIVAALAVLLLPSKEKSASSSAQGMGELSKAATPSPGALIEKPVAEGKKGAQEQMPKESVSGIPPATVAPLQNEGDFSGAATPGAPLTVDKAAQAAPPRTAAVGPNGAAAQLSEESGAPAATKSARSIFLLDEAPARADRSGGEQNLFSDALTTNARQHLSLTEPVNVAPIAQSQTANFRNVEVPSPATVVLDSFQVEQRGDALRVIDMDGSTYVGNILTADAQLAAAANLNFSDQREADANVSQNRYASRRSALEAVAPQEAGAENNYFFRVTGTNRTLNQRVVFSGTILGATNAIQFDPKRQNNQQQFFNFIINNSTIVGRAQLEDAKEININAVPVKE